MGTENGAGHSTKLCNQILCGLSILATCEAFTLAKKSNIDIEKMFSVVRSGVAASPLLNRFGARILEANPEVGRTVRKRDNFIKDLGLIIEAARDTGASLPGSTLVQQLYSTTGTEEIHERGAVGLMLALEKWQQSLS